MKYLSSIMKNADRIEASAMHNRKKQCGVYGSPMRFTFYPTRSVWLSTDKAYGPVTSFYVIGMLHLEGGSDTALCAELTKDGIDPFWVVYANDYKGRMSLYDDHIVATVSTKVIFNMYPYEDGSFLKMIKSVLATFDPTTL